MIDYNNLAQYTNPFKKRAYNNILDGIGNTSLIEIVHLNPNPRVKIFAKTEFLNTGGSVKDRIALSMIEHAEQSGELTPEKIILEATSGNTGIGLAMVAAIKGYKILLAMAENASEERKKILAAYGADFLLTPPHLSTDGAIEVAYDLYRQEPDKYLLTDQFNNPYNLLAHYFSTGKEIWQQTRGAVTHFVATIGTTGTLMGTGARLKQYNSDIKIIGAEPTVGHAIQGLKNLKDSYIPGIFNRSLMDQKLVVENEQAFQTSRELAKKEGLLVGMSAGAAVYAAQQVARQLDEGIVVTILPDGGERYLSTQLFQGFTPEATKSNLKIYNTLARKKEPFKSLKPNEVSIYTCGPTVNTVPHLALYRRLIVADLLRRNLEFCGYEVKHVINITDLDDNTIEAALKSGVDMRELTTQVFEQFLQELEALNIKPFQYARASDYVQEMIEMAENLVLMGYAYIKHRSVYFDIAKYADYGKLSGVDLSKIKLGATVDLDNYEKENPRDFTLFKRANLAELKNNIFFKTKWGNMRPSWHIECAAMCTKLLGESIDIHTSCLDLTFPHHENEIAITEALSGKQLANYWLHNETVLNQGSKMSHQGKNAIFLEDIFSQGFSGREIRYALLSIHYRQPLHFSLQRLTAAKNALQRFDMFIWNTRSITGNGEDSDALPRIINEMETSFEQSMNDDLNISAALGAVFNFIRKANCLISAGTLAKKDGPKIIQSLNRLDQVLGIMPSPEEEAISEEIYSIIKQREKARKQKDWQKADQLRENLKTEHGIIVEDTPLGSRWKPVAVNGD